jgi:nucleoside-diphosphate-sugar epimerase
MTTILITGSTGKSGGRVAHRLRELGYSVWAVTRLLGGATKPKGAPNLGYRCPFTPFRELGRRANRVPT